MRILCIFICVIFNWSSLSLADDDKTSSERALRFTPHITAEAWTGKQWSVSLQRSVGSNLNTEFLLSSLNLSLTNRIEIGTSPLFYLLDDHLGNLTFKYNFWRSKTYLWSIGFNASSFYLRDENGNKLEDKLNLLSFQVLLNYLPTWTSLKFGVNLVQSEAVIQSSDSAVGEFFLGDKHEFGIDITKPFHGNKEATLGFGWLREAGITALEEVEFGLGLSFRLYRPGKFLSSPTLGVHTGLKTGTVSFLVSTSFY